MKKYFTVDAAYNSWKFVRDGIIKKALDLDFFIGRQYYKYKVAKKT